MSKLFKTVNENIDLQNKENISKEEVDLVVDILNNTSFEDFNIDIYNDSIDIYSNLYNEMVRRKKSLESYEILSKNYIINFNTSKNFINNISHNLGIRNSFPTLEDYQLSTDKYSIHNITLEGFVDIIKSIWEKIKQFFKSLYETIINFFKRLVGVEPTLNYIDKYIEKNISNIKDKKLQCHDKELKINSDLAKFLLNYNSNSIDIERLMLSGVSKIKEFENIVNTVYEISSDMNNKPEILNINIMEANIKNLNDSISKIDYNAIKKYIATLSSILDKFKIEAAANDPVNYKDEINKSIGPMYSAIGDVINLYIDNIRNLKQITDSFAKFSSNKNLDTDLRIKEIYQLNKKVDYRNVDYEEINDDIQSLQSEFKNPIIDISMKYDVNKDLTTPCILNLNIINLYIKNNRESFNIENSDSSNDTNSLLEDEDIKNDFINNIKIYNRFKVLKRPSEVAPKTMPVLYRIEDIETLYKIYNNIKKYSVSNIKNNIEKIQNKIKHVNSLYDNTNVLLEKVISTIEEFNNVMNIIIKFVRKLEESENFKSVFEGRTDGMNAYEELRRLIDDNTINTIKEINSIKNAIKRQSIAMMNFIMYNNKNLTNSVASFEMEISKIKQELLKELALYIYRSTDTFR